MRQADGSAGDANYGEIGRNYSAYRQPEPAIESMIRAALGDAQTVLNVGAGAGSYEPRDRAVTALEPSASMRAQRPADLPEAIDGVAERLPFADKSFDAVMATFTVHQWPDLEAGLAQMRRVAHGPVVILTCDPAQVQDFWLNDYAPGVLAAEARRYPTFDQLRTGLGTSIETMPVPIPLTCRDGFNEAYYGRPEMFLDEKARLSCSAWSFVPPDVAANYVGALQEALTCGQWDASHGALRTLPTWSGSLYLVISRP
ncbi:class I SAM-dependent methyltransferase [Hyphomonas sp.]|uniref:class I SAM-dependent methyltransferase n=1 Tax=Hyphomonas sp. TaxID=87 RepID=UPI0039192CE7